MVTLKGTNRNSLLLHRCKFCAKKTQISTEPKVKRENQQDATNSMFIIKLPISTCFGHHYAHHQENKTVSCCMRCSAWVCRLWLAVALWRCVVSCVHTTHLHKTTANHSLTHPGRTPHAAGHGLILLMMGIMMPETC